MEIEGPCLEKSHRQDAEADEEEAFFPPSSPTSDTDMTDGDIQDSTAHLQRQHALGCVRSTR